MQAVSHHEGTPELPIRASGIGLSAWCILAAFGTYFCMYAFRKPFTAAPYTGVLAVGIGYKTALVASQVLGYMVSKFLGIKIVAEAEGHGRIRLLLVLIAAAELSLVMFGLTPSPYNLIWMFCNGLPLGMVFGLVLSFLEGRKQTEAMAAGLCTSFILADGVTKSVGASLLNAGVSEYWMPAAAGAFFLLPLLIFAWMLKKIPRPSLADVTARSERAPMNGQERLAFFRRYAAGVTLLVFVYLLITILRSIRADFAPEIWAGLREQVPPALFSWSEIVVAAGVLVLNGLASLIHDNRRAFFYGLSTAVGGSVLIALSLIGLRLGFLPSFAFMVLMGIGLYLPYLAVHTTLFERLLAMTRERGNVGYLMYLADSFGYLGYVGVLLGHNWLARTDDFLSFFLNLGWFVSGTCLLLLLPCWHYFSTRVPARTEFAPTVLPAADWATVEQAS